MFFFLVASGLWFSIGFCGRWGKEADKFRLAFRLLPGTRLGVQHGDRRAGAEIARENQLRFELTGAEAADNAGRPLAVGSRYPRSSKHMDTLANLATELPNAASAHIDELPTLSLLTLINDEDAKVSAAVRAEIPQIAKAVDAIAERFERGGRLFYIGAGTSGRLGVLDASECPPTFSVPATLFQGLIAGGDAALRLSSEHSEDSPEEGAADLEAAGFAEGDTLIGIAASGRTPYVLGALRYARSQGALTIALTCVVDSEMAAAAEHTIAPATGPEVLTGSTRMKAGTATKLVLNMISTGVMIRTGAVYGNLMVNVKPTNAKLVDRAQRIIAAATGCDLEASGRLLEASGRSVKTAIVMGRFQVDRASAEARLTAARGVLSRALA